MTTAKMPWPVTINRLSVPSNGRRDGFLIISSQIGVLLFPGKAHEANAVSPDVHEYVR